MTGEGLPPCGTEPSHGGLPRFGEMTGRKVGPGVGLTAVQVSSRIQRPIAAIRAAECRHNARKACWIYTTRARAIRNES